MRVLHVYAGNLFGGVEAMLCTLARERAAVPGMEPAFALAYEGRLAGELRALGAEVEVLGGARLSRPWTIAPARRRMVAAARRARADVVVCHSAWSHGIFGPCARAAGARLAFWLHDAPSGGWAERLARRAEPEVAVCTSAWVRARLPALFPAVRSAVVHPPVPASVVAPGTRAAVRAELDTPANAVVVAQASRMEAWKGHEVHLRALAALAEDPRWVCWMAGGAQRPAETRHRDRMHALARALGIAPRVRWLGERADVPRLLAGADVLCQPNLTPEPFGMTYVEAMRAGVPVVGSAMGGALEIVDDSCGIRVPAGDVGATARALRALLNDGAARARMSAAAPARALALCDPAAQLRRLHAVLEGAA
ncbi:MAG TPA: glycosyltransferase [Longimicrobium sp.]|nr:glycosyltransferase [Longimicrobium sp.]